MSLDITVSIKGIDAIQKAILKLAPELQKAAYKAVISAGARVILRNAKARVPKNTGLLKRSLGIKAKVYGSTPYAVIGPRMSVQGKPKMVTSKNGKARKSIATPWRYAHMVENGTATSSAKPFIRPALDASRSEVHAEFQRGLEKHLARVARRLAKKASA